MITSLAFFPTSQLLISMAAQLPPSIVSLPCATHRLACVTNNDADHWGTAFIQPSTWNLCCNSGLDISQLLDAGTSENAVREQVVRSRKRQRQRLDADLVVGRHGFSSASLEHVGTSSPPPAIPHSTISTRLRGALHDNILHPSPTCTSSRDTLASFPSMVAEEFNSQFRKQQEDIDELIIKVQGQTTKQILEERWRRLDRAFGTLLKEGFMERLREKERELHKVIRSCQELEERVEQLHLELRFWHGLARSSELVLFKLKTSLEQVAAETRDQKREGCGESEVEDVESRMQGDVGDEHDRSVEENCESRAGCVCKCKICLINTVSILLLPCRHLCLCKECENKLGKCPLCGSVKNASVQVYMS